MSDVFEDKINDGVYQEPISPFDTQVMLNRVLLLDWKDLQSAQKIESDLYLCLQKFPQKTEYLILMMLVQLVLGKIERANAFAYKIWEKGGNLNQIFRLLYAHLLSVINLPDMALQIFGSVLDEINSLHKNLFTPLINFTFAHGNKELLQLVAAHAAQDVFDAMENLILFYDKKNYWKALSDFQQIVFEKCNHNLVDYGVTLNMDKGYCVVSFDLFVLQNAHALQAEINNLIDDYCVKNKIINYDNLYFNVLAKNQHQPLENILLPVL